MQRDDQRGRTLQRLSRAPSRPPAGTVACSLARPMELSFDSAVAERPFNPARAAELKAKVAAFAALWQGEAYHSTSAVAEPPERQPRGSGSGQAPPAYPVLTLMAEFQENYSFVMPYGVVDICCTPIPATITVYDEPWPWSRSWSGVVDIRRTPVPAKIVKSVFDGKQPYPPDANGEWDLERTRSYQRRRLAAFAVHVSGYLSGAATSYRQIPDTNLHGGNLRLLFKPAVAGFAWQTRGGGD